MLKTSQMKKIIITAMTFVTISACNTSKEKLQKNDEKNLKKRDGFKPSLSLFKTLLDSFFI